MKLIFRYLKPFVLSLTVAFAFLLIQVACDLGLPKLMSNIVDTGIQAGGIEAGSPAAIGSDEIGLLMLFLNEQDAAKLISGYSMVPAGSSEELAKLFPVAASQNIYRRVDTEATKDSVEETYRLAVGAWTLALQDMQGNSILDIEPVLSELEASGKLDAYRIASAKDSTIGAKAEVQFTRMFYEELGVNLEKRQREYILGMGLNMIGVALLGGMSAIVVGWFASKIATSVAMRMRRDIFEKVGLFASEEYERFSTASLITRTTNDVQQIQQLVLTGIRLVLFAPIMAIGGIVLAVRSSVSMSWVIAVAVVSIVVAILVLFKLSLPKYKILQMLVDRLNQMSRENLTGMLVIRAFGNERYEENRFESTNDRLRSTNRFVQRTTAFLVPAMTLVMNLVTVLIVWAGAKAIAASKLQIGSMMAFMQYAMQIIAAFLFMSFLFMLVPRALASAKRIQEVLSAPLSVREPECARGLLTGEGVTIDFNEVSFRYLNAEEPVFDRISFTAKPGETTAIIGMTGAGKSTLVNMVPRFYDATNGSITLNGTNILDLKLSELRDNIGYVPQKGFLFAGDIESNVRYGKDSAEWREIQQALEVAQAASFVDQLNEGIATQIAQGGENVSGGQRQRIAIARALVKKAPIYIFDDCFSALDLKTDAALRSALKWYTANSTVLIVAQRVSTIKDADRIIVLHEGGIIGQGTHSELLDNCETYRAIAESQRTKED